MGVSDPDKRRGHLRSGRSTFGRTISVRTIPYPHRRELRVREGVPTSPDVSHTEEILGTKYPYPTPPPYLRMVRYSIYQELTFGLFHVYVKVDPSLGDVRWGRSV